MPSFDLRHIYVAPYQNNNGTVSYGTAISAGDAMTVAMELRFAEARLYAESTLAEYIRKATGGTISMGVKYIPDDAQHLMFGNTAKSRTVSGGSVSGNLTTGKDVAAYVGVAFYAPAMVDGVEKYVCVFVSRVLFGPPSMNYQTLGENITFNTPTTTGEFLADHSTGKNLFEVATVDTEAKAIAWCAAVFS